MANPPFGEELDGTVGSLAPLEEPAPSGRPGKSPLGIFVSGDALSNRGAMGLAGEIGLLIQGFIHSPASTTKRRRRHPDPRDDIEVALHGLKLDPDREAELHHRIRELVRQRLVGGGTKK